MSKSFPQTSANVVSADSAIRILEDALSELEILAFPWPQEKDSGIDLIGFVTSLNHAGARQATAFVAGVQCRGKTKEFGKKGYASVRIGKHRDYWETATMPVFVASVSVQGRSVLIEDARPGMAERDAKRIVTSARVQDAASDIRLRIVSSALAPWISDRLRARRLMEREDGLDPTSTWSILAWAMTRQGAPAPRTRRHLEQYFDLLSWLMNQTSSVDAFRADIVRAKGRDDMDVYSVLMHAFDLLGEFGLLHADGELGEDELRAQALVQEMWSLALVAGQWTPVHLASTVLERSPAIRPRDGEARNLRDPGHLLQDLVDGCTLTDVLQRLRQLNGNGRATR